MAGIYPVHAGPLHAEEPDPATAIDISAGTLSDALRLIAVARHSTILFAPTLVTGRHVGAQRLTGDAPAMLRHLLAGTPLRLRITGPHTILIEAAPSPRPVRAPTPPPVGLPPLGDIMVTAMRRPTRLADTPLSMIAISGSELDRARVSGVQALASLAPSLAVTSMGSGMTRLSLRGVFAAGEPTVGFYYGNVPVAGPGGSTTDPGLMTPDLNLIDVDRVEVLRGPQGTLFGTNSLAGTVRILFKPPDPTRRELITASSLAVTQGGAPSYAVSAIANLPVRGDSLALRAVVYRDQRGGVIDNPGLALSNVDGQTRKGGRLALRWQATPRWRLDLAGAYQQGRVADGGNATAGAPRDQTDALARTPFTDRLTVASGEVNGAIGSLQLNATLAHFGWTPHRQFDFSAAERAHRGDATACAAYLQPGIVQPGTVQSGKGTCSPDRMAAFAAYVDSQTPSLLDQPFTVQVDSGELRLSGNGPLTWTGGGFVSRRRDTGISTALPVDPATGLPSPDTAPTATRSFATRLDEFALFADGSWHLRPWLALSAGGRYFDYRRQANGIVSVANPITGPFVPSSFDETYHADGTVGRARIELRPTPRLLMFGQVSSGFRPGGINVVPGLDTSLAAYRDDRMTSWETGGRIRLDGDRLRLDVAAYHQMWSRMQYAATTTDGSYSFITNIGTARINGGEISLSWEPTGHLLARLEATVTDARLASDQINAIATTPGQRGDRLPYVAPVAASFDVLFDRALTSRLTLLASFNAHYIGRAYDSFRGTGEGPRQTMGDTATLDADIGLRRAGMQVDLFVQNLGNSRAIVWSGRGLGVDNVQRARPRTAGLALRHNF